MSTYKVTIKRTFENETRTGSVMQPPFRVRT
jgi:hypothetical protein